MGYTNSTTNYHLPQFIGTDKPSWLGDFNTAMNAIDSAIKSNADDISALGTRMTATETVANSASTNASTALTNASTAQSTADSALTSANNAATAASNAQTTANSAGTAASTADSKATSAQTTANSALTKANAIESKLNLTSFTSFDNSSITSSYGSVSAETNIQVATNNDGSVGKIYGRITVTGLSTNNDVTITIPNTALRPESQLTINGVCLRAIYTSTEFNDVGMTSISIATNGTVTITAPSNTLIARQDFNLIACLLFLTDFGDSPI